MLKKPSEDQHRELGIFFSAWRPRLHPARFGPPEEKRRTPELRRKKVALLTGVSVSWYIWSEQGLDIPASWETLENLASVLQFSCIEAKHLSGLSLRVAPPG